MAVIFQVNGFCASDATHVADVRIRTTFNGYRVNAIVSENCNQLGMVARILQHEPRPQESLLQWIPLGAVIWIVTPCKIFEVTRHRDNKATITSKPYGGVYGAKAFPLHLLLRLNLNSANAMFANELIHGYICQYIKIVRYASLGLRSRKLAPPVLPRFIWSAFKRP